MGIKCLQTVFKIRDPVLSDTLIPGKSDTLSLLEMGKLIHCESHSVELYNISDK